MHQNMNGRVSAVLTARLKLLVPNEERMIKTLGHAKRGSHTTLCIPHRKHSYLVTAGDIVDVIARFHE